MSSDSDFEGDDYPEEFVQSWVLAVKPGKLYAQELPNDLNITQASLGEETDNGARVCLFSNQNDEKHVVCSLTAGVCEQVHLNLVYAEGEEISFSSNAKNATIHLFGFIRSGVDSDEESEDEESEDEKEEIAEEVNKKELANLKRKLAAVEEAQSTPTKKAKAEAKTPVKSKSEKSVAQTKSAPATPAPAQQKPETPKKTAKQLSGKLSNGLTYKISTVGKGKPANRGKRVTVKYVGKLQKNGRVFDSNNNFSFRLGVGEVIKGWDTGVEGMQIGESRTLTCPPHLAYGKRGAPPDIPPNATLIFDVTLKNVQ